MKTRLIVSFAAVLSSLTGCMFLRPVPSDFGPISLTYTSSASVKISWCWIEHASDREDFVLHGYVERQPHAKTTTDTHLHVRYLGANGDALRDEPVEFYPREIKAEKRRGETEPYAVFTQPLKVVPKGTVRIEVQAQDGLQ